MLVKLGVYVSELKPAIRKKLPLIENLFSKLLGIEAVITSTNEGDHSPGSLHYANLAVDLRLPDGFGRLLPDLRKHLGPDYDVVEERNHVHIEYDPKK